MRFSVDAHAIGQHLTGNETYVRNLLNCFATLDQEADFITYLSREDAFADVPRRFLKRRVAVNPFVRLGFDLPRRLRHDKPHLLHVQYTAPSFLLHAHRCERSRCQFSGTSRLFHSFSGAATSLHRTPDGEVGRARDYAE